MNVLIPVCWFIGISILCSLVGIAAHSGYAPQCDVERFAPLSDLVKRKGKDEEKQLLAELLLRDPACSQIPADVWPLYEPKPEPHFKPQDALKKRPNVASLSSAPSVFDGDGDIIQQADLPQPDGREDA